MSKKQMSKEELLNKIKDICIDNVHPDFLHNQSINLSQEILDLMQEQEGDKKDKVSSKYIIMVEPTFPKDFGKEENGDDRVLTKDEQNTLDKLDDKINKAINSISCSTDFSPHQLSIDCWIDEVEVEDFTMAHLEDK